MDKAILSPRLTLRYAPSRNLTFRTGYARGFRAPQTYDEDLHVSAVGGDVALISIADGLRPENSYALTLSADYWNQKGAWQMNLLVEGFYTRLDDVFVLVENGFDQDGNILLVRTNASGAYVTGANIEGMVGKGDDFSIQSGLTLQASRYIEPFEWSADVPAQKKMFGAPDVYGYINLTGNPGKHYSASLNCTFTGPLLIQHYAGFIEKDSETMTPSFVDCSARIARHFHLSNDTTLEISLACKNFLDQHQKDLDFGAKKDSRYIYGPVQPRSVYLGVKLSL